MGRYVDAPRPTSFRFNADDQRDVVKLLQAIAPVIERFQRDEHLPAGVIAIALANMARDFLQVYPATFREKVIKEINTQIFEAAPSDGPRLIRLH